MLRKIVLSLPLLLAAGAAWAHPGHESVSGFIAAAFSSGFAHPFMGWDHLLAMLTLGAWAAQWKGRAIWIAPPIFVVGMSAGALLALGGGTPAIAEHGIALSVILIGLLVALVPARSELAKLALPLIVIGGAMHGFAHGAELPARMGATAYIGGFVCATLILHGGGMLIGTALRTRASIRRVSGLAVALGGLLILSWP